MTPYYKMENTPCCFVMMELLSSSTYARWDVDNVLKNELFVTITSLLWFILDILTGS